MRGHGSQWISNKINFRHSGQLKKLKSWEPFWSYQLNSTANPAHSPQNWAYFEVNGLDWHCCLAGSSKTAPRIFIFFNFSGCRMFILFEIHWDPCPRIFTTYFWWYKWCVLWPSIMTNIDAFWQDLVCLTMFRHYILPGCEQKQLLLVRNFLHYKSVTEGSLRPQNT